MRSREFLSEAGLSNTGLRSNYISNLISMIRNNTPITLTPQAASIYGKSVIVDTSEADRIQDILDSGAGELNHKGYLKIAPIGKIKLTSTDNTGQSRYINLTNIEKTSAIKGKDTDFNIGDIGEIALGTAAGAKFLAGGAEIGLAEFISLANKMTPGAVMNKKGKLLDSLKLTYQSSLAYPSGKTDIINLVIVAPGRSVKEFQAFMKSPDMITPQVESTILSALDYARTAEKIQAGIEQASADPNTNTIEIVCDGVSDQKGTKADLIMNIDGHRINLISAKTGPSQLGQASGHDWQKQAMFFKTVFGVDISLYESIWGSSNEDHLAALQKVYSNLIIPKVMRLTGGNSVQAEVELVKTISNGLIRYSNNYNEETSNIETIDIVKLSTEPGSPGYSLLRIDNKLTAALQNANLVGKSTQNQQGIQVHGIVNEESILLFKVRSYHSRAGNVVRTIIEGGPLLEILAKTTFAPPVADAPIPQAAAVKPAKTPPSIVNQTRTMAQGKIPMGSTAGAPVPK